MDIIIVGCGKVGSALAEVLSEEHNVTVIDSFTELFCAASKRAFIVILYHTFSHPSTKKRTFYN